MSIPKQRPNSDHEEPQRQPSKTLTVVLFVLLALWVSSIALGTLIFGEDFNWRKPIFVLAPMFVFLSVWGILLLGKSRRAKQV
jgi:hypothetical protein